MTTTERRVGPEQLLRDGGAAAVWRAADGVAADVAGRADRHDREASFATENIEALWSAGLGNLTVPAELGGVGADLATTAGAVRRVAAGDASTALVWVMHLTHVKLMTESGADWPDHLVARVIADSLAGPALMNSLRVEPELGTPARGGIPATRAVRTTAPDGSPAWSVSGHKIYTTGSHGLRWLAVFGATGPDDPDGVRTGVFLVPGDAPGIEIRDTWDHLGMRASASNDVLLHDVIIPQDHAIGLQTPGSVPPRRSGVLAGWTTALLLAIYQGVATAARDWLGDYLNDRVPSNLGAPLASLPRFQTAAGEIEVLLHTNTRLLATLAADIDAGGERAESAGEQAALTKVVVTRNVIATVELALSLIGNPGLSYRHPLQRHYRDALCSRIHTPQDDAVLLGAGKAALTRAR